MIREFCKSYTEACKDLSLLYSEEKSYEHKQIQYIKLKELLDEINGKHNRLRSNLYYSLILFFFSEKQTIPLDSFTANIDSLKWMEYKEMYLLELAELYFYLGEKAKLKSLMRNLESVYRNLLLDVNENPVYLREGISILHAMSGNSYKYPTKTIDMIKNFHERLLKLSLP